MALKRFVKGSATYRCRVCERNTRVTVVRTYTSGRFVGHKSRSYIDHCVCEHCGFTWEQEWMPAGI